MISKQNLEYITKCMKRVCRQKNYSLERLDKLIKKNVLILNPDYQRAYIKTNKEASKFVESVFLGFVIPQIQLYVNENEKIEVIDGQQRITSLIKFLNNQYCLCGLKELSELNGLFFSDLPETIQNQYIDFELTSNVMEQSEDEKYKYMVFERLNINSKKLSKQEIRNCIYRSNFLNLVNKYVKENETLILSLNIKPALNNRRFEISEFMLKIISVSQNFNNLKSSISKNINYLLENSYNFDDIKIENLIKTFDKILKLIKNNIGLNLISDDNSITKINLEILMISLILINDIKLITLNSEKVAKSVKFTINEDKEYSHELREVTNNMKSVVKKVNIMKKNIMRHINNNGVLLDKKRCFDKQDKIKIWNDIKSEDSIVRCAVCGNRIYNLEDCEVDHIIPWSIGGKTIFSNAQLVHSICNKFKTNK